ncbi:L,D-transpeptidase family protein [Paenibacillus sp. DMB5]|uniref:L,D-transpeptidase family protein n=1 Tax=Paenibacillus sp. DMB5 TaxID=1780103 RepID=UPI000A835AF3|nr:L,D-transpeptidase family protein [Paenibacillus sp. DMB5]
MHKSTRRRILLVVMCLFLPPVLVLVSLTPEAAAAGFAASWPYKADRLESSQMVVVTASSSRSTTGVLTLRENRGGSWKTVLSGIPVTLGAGGIGKTKEGDKRTPSGVFRLGEAFGSAAGPEGLKLPYSIVGSRDYWIDAPGSAEYNQRVTFTGDPGSRWASYERLLHPLYKYAVVVRYNDEPVVPGKGSAIFLHIWRGAGQPTAGCIAMSESNLLKLMKQLDPELSPAIAIGTAD